MNLRFNAKNKAPWGVRLICAAACLLMIVPAALACLGGAVACLRGNVEVEVTPSKPDDDGWNNGADENGYLCR